MMKINIGLVWHNPNSGNLGCSALAISNCLLLESAISKKHSSIKFTLFGDAPESSINGQDELEEIIGQKIDYKRISLRDLKKEPFSLLRIFDGYHYIFDISAGDSFSDIYGWKRFATQVTYKIAAIQRSKLILAPQTIGPFKYNLSRIIAKYIIRKSFLSFARDPKSFDELKRLYSGSNIIEVTDVAFSLPFKKEIVPNENNKKIGINISGLLAAGGYNSKNQFNLKSNYLETIEVIIKYLQKLDYEIHIIPHVFSSEQMSLEDDLSISQMIADRYSLTPPKSFRNPIEAKSYISGMNFFIGSRMHATIASLSSGVPVIPLAYSRKFDPLFQSLNYPHTINLTDNTSSEILEMVLEKIKNIDLLRQDTRKSLSIAEEKTGTYLKHLKGIL